MLALIRKYQVQFGARKLVVARGGQLHFDEPDRQQVQVNLAAELLGTEDNPAARYHEFEGLVESMPTEYVRMIRETLLDSPFVAALTEAGTRYVTERQRASQ